jgi:hypothetical protein
VAKGLSNYIDALLEYPMKRTMTELFPMNVSFLSEFPDFLSFSVVLLLSSESKNVPNYNIYYY